MAKVEYKSTLAILFMIKRNYRNWNKDANPPIISENSVLPKGVEAHIQIVDTHNDPTLWSHPEVFDPDRFLPENSQGRHPFSYIPFSGGYRNCIGQKFAMLELKAVLGFLLHSFVFEAIDETKKMCHTMDMVLRTNHPLRVKLLPIESFSSY